VFGCDTMLVLTAKILVGYLSLLVMAYFFQRNLIYMPFGGTAVIPDHISSMVEPMAVVASDGTVTEGWYIKGLDKASKVTVIQFHGNAGHRFHRLYWALPFRRLLGCSVVLTDYRGYGGNPGKPTEEGLYDDAWATLEYIRSEYPGKIVLYGESIGGGVALEIAKRAAEMGKPVDGVILQAAFTSLTAIASSAYWFLWPKYLLKDKYDNISKISKIRAPVMVIHGTADNIVPFAHGVGLFRTANSPKTMYTVPGGDHNSLVHNAGMEYFAQVESFLNKYVDGNIRLRHDSNEEDWSNVHPKVLAKTDPIPGGGAQDGTCKDREGGSGDGSRSCPYLQSS